MSFPDPLVVNTVNFVKLPEPGLYLNSSSTVDEPMYWKMATNVTGDRQRSQFGITWHTNPTLPAGVTFNSQPSDIVQRIYCVADINRAYTNEVDLASLFSYLTNFATEANLLKLLQGQL